MPMASVASSTQPPQQSQTTSSDPNSTPLSWEGDKMFNIYIYDYCHKRGFKKTAKELLIEADIPPESTPPINARQGLLFEWWSVFWVLFQAKSNTSENVSNDAITYTQHQARQTAARMQATQSTAPGPNGPMSLGPQSTMQSRMINGMPSRFLPNGSLPNGVVHPGAPGSGPFGQPNGASNPNNPSHGPGNPPAQATGFLPPNVTRPPLNGPPLPGSQVQQVRTSTNGPFQTPIAAHSPQGTSAPLQGQQGQFGMNASPHMANLNMGRGLMPASPMNPNQQGANAPQSNQHPQQGQQGQFGMGRPPSRTNTPGGMTQPSPSLAARQVNSDIVNMEVLQIPNAILENLKSELGISGKDISALSMSDKQRIINLWRNRRASVQAKPGDNAVPGSSHPMIRQQQSQQNLNRNKRSSTSPGEEHETLPRTESSPPERKRMRTSPMQTPSMAPMTYPGQQQPGMQPPGMQPGPSGIPGISAPGSLSGPNPGMPSAMQPGGMQPGGPLGMSGGMQGPGGMQPPGGPGMMPQGTMQQNSASANNMQPGAGGMQQGAPGGGPGPGMQPPMGGGPTGMMMQRPQMNGIPHPGGQMGLPPQMGGIPQMSSSSMGPPGNPQNVMQALTPDPQMYRQNMHNMHKNNMPLNATSPAASSDPSFNINGPQFNPPRPGTNPTSGGQSQNRMPPPPSPAPGKDGAKDGKTDGSPRNQQTPNAAPATPANQPSAPSNQGTPVGGARTAPSPAPNPVMSGMNPMNPPAGMNMGVGMMGMNSSANLNQPPTGGMNNGGGGGGNTGNAQGAGSGAGGIGGVSGMNFLAGMNGMAGMNAAAGTGLGMNMNMNPAAGGGMGSMDLFSAEFISGVANALDDIDPSIFRPEGDLSFERDFGQWFNQPDDPHDPLDLK